MPSQDTYLGCGFNPQLEHMQEATNQYFSVTSMFLSLCPPPLLSLKKKLKKINKTTLGEDF